MKKIISSFSNLSTEQIYDAMKLRQDVFVIEQNCIYNDFDGYDKKAMHFLIYKDDMLAAYSRIFAPNIKYQNESSIGRILVSKSHRGGTLGKLLIKESIEYCIKQFPDSVIRIEAQAALEKYYSDLGFLSDSEVYAVDDIPHLQMIYNPKN